MIRLTYVVALLRHYILGFQSFRRKIGFAGARLLALQTYAIRRAGRWLRTSPENETYRAVHTRLAEIQALFINLNSRTDRRSEITEEFSRLGFRNVLRVQAVRTADGHTGAALSHLAAVRYARWRDLDYVMILEDDAEFLVDGRMIEGVIADFLGNAALDVLAFGHNTKLLPSRISPTLSLITDSSSAGCYVAKRGALPILESTLLHSSVRLQAGEPSDTAAFDQLWKSVQRKRLLFACPTVMMFRQRLSYSDTQGHELAWPPLD